LVLHVSSQRPHTLRHALAAMLGIAEARLRVMTPDASGGFGARNRLIPEEVVACAPALKLDSPIRWVADRYEHHLMAGAQAREQLCDLTLHATRDGIALGVKGDLRVDAGAYALWPTDGCAEAAAPPRSNPASRRAVLPRARMARCCWRRPRRGGPISRPAARRGDAAGRGGRGTITLTVNGVATVVPGKPRESLAHVRRDRLGLTATGIGRRAGQLPRLQRAAGRRAGADLPSARAARRRLRGHDAGRAARRHMNDRAARGLRGGAGAAMQVLRRGQAGDGARPGVARGGRRRGGDSRRDCRAALPLHRQ
jgi:hypothetical protein